MNAEKLLRYEEEIKYEIFGTSYVSASNYLADIRKEIKSEKQVLSSFLTVNEYAKNLKHI